MAKKITTALILKELAGFPPVYSLNISFHLNQAPLAGDVERGFCIASSHHRLSLECLESRLKLMTRQEFKELLLQLGQIEVKHAGPDWLLQKPVFDIIETTKWQ